MNAGPNPGNGAVLVVDARTGADVETKVETHGPRPVL